jgi:DNA-directed RNA polymerase specialized sigma24 family protein
LVIRHEQAVKAVAFSVLGDHGAAGDVAREAFLLAFGALAGLKDGNVFGPWLLAIARHRALARSRHQESYSRSHGCPCVASIVDDVIRAMAEEPDCSSKTTRRLHSGL